MNKHTFTLTDETPREPGWYWWISPSTGFAEVIEVFIRPHRKYLVTWSHEWGHKEGYVAVLDINTKWSKLIPEPEATNDQTNI